jgi:hypothetical protein
MRWSYADLLSTPAPVVDEIIAWMRELADAEAKRERERERLARKR